nr:MAG TPA: hypothetical protein [Caudoviricetes sp.]
MSLMPQWYFLLILPMSNQAYLPHGEIHFLLIKNIFFQYFVSRYSLFFNTITYNII